MKMLLNFLFNYYTKPSLPGIFPQEIARKINKEKKMATIFHAILASIVSILEGR